MVTNNKVNHMTDAIKNNSVEIQLQEIAKRGNIYFKDVTFDQSGYPTNVGEYRALIGFKDQQDAKRFAELTDGEFTLFFRKDGWDLLAYRGSARLTDIHMLAGRDMVVLLDGDENLHQLCEKIHGMSLIDYLKDVLDIDEDEVFIKEIVKHYKQDHHIDSVEVEDYLKLISENEDDKEIFMKIAEDIYDKLIFLENYKGCKGYVVIDDVNWSVVGEYDSEYPSYYKEDTKHYIFGVMYQTQTFKLKQNKIKLI